MNKSVHTSFLVFVLGGFLAAAPMPPSLPDRTPAQSAAESASAYANYSYYGDRYRDPFVPLIGEVRSDQSLDRPPPVSSLALKGIVSDTNGRMALLTSGVSSYILRGGRLYDGRNHMVKKISGVIKTDSVIVIGADRSVRELRTKTTL